MGKVSKSVTRRKTGCLTCRARHRRCDESRPRCGACDKAGLFCQQNSIILFTPEEPNKGLSVASSQNKHSKIDPSFETAFLLRQYQNGIAVWMDLFDFRSTYQIQLIKESSRSPLLVHCILSLAARQEAKLSTPQFEGVDWNVIAERNYVRSLNFLREALEVREQILEHLLPASILLLSYELMSFPGQDYSRHFEGAKSLFASQTLLCYYDSALIRTSWWILLRHDVDLAMTEERCPTLDTGPSHSMLSANSTDEDQLGNEALLIASKVIYHVFNKDGLEDDDLACEEHVALRERIDRWSIIADKIISGITLDDGTIWYSTSAGASAMQLHLVSKMLLLVHSRDFSANHQPNIERWAEEIVQISSTHLSDAARVQAVHPLYQAAKSVTRAELRRRALSILADTERMTGFHTQSKIDSLLLLKPL